MLSEAARANMGDTYSSLTSGGATHDMILLRRPVSCRDIEQLVVRFRPYDIARRSCTPLLFVFTSLHGCTQRRRVLSSSQFVTCPTRKNKTIDLLYPNMRDAYSATPSPCQGNLIIIWSISSPSTRHVYKGNPEPHASSGNGLLRQRRPWGTAPSLMTGVCCRNHRVKTKRESHTAPLAT